jgi:hypothetical protein
VFILSSSLETVSLVLVTKNLSVLFLCVDRNTEMFLFAYKNTVRISVCTIIIFQVSNLYILGTYF